MLHYTLNTGHARRAPRSEVTDASLDALASTLSTGRHAIPGSAGYEVEIAFEGAALAATVQKDGRPLAFVVVAPDSGSSDAGWKMAESLYLSMVGHGPCRDRNWAPPVRPASTPWCASVLLILATGEAEWLDDFEVRLAWAWVERHRVIVN